MADKETSLSIVIRTVDKATAKIKAINERLDAATKPLRNFKEALGDLKSKSGLDDVLGGFKGVGSAIGDLLSKVAMIGGVVGVAVAGLFSLVGSFDDLGDKAEAMGVSVDFLAQMRYAAEQSGAAVEALDSGLQGFSTSLGMARAGTGKMAGFLKLVSPELLKQLKAAKSNEAAFDLLAAAMDKIEDPAKRAAFAQKTLGDASLAPLLNRGAKGIKALRAEYLGTAGSMEDAAAKAGAVDSSMKKLKAATDGVKAAIVSGLAPALEIVVKQLQEWFTAHREDIAEWAASLGKKLPGAIETLKNKFKSIVDFIRPFVDSTTKLKIIAVALAAIIAGPLISAIVSLGIAIATTPVGWILAGIVAIAAGAYLLIDNWDAVSGFFTDIWDTVADKFGWAAHLIKLVLWPILGLPTLFIGAWDSLTSFFSGLWDGITSVFQKAWSIIKVIVDKVAWGVEKVKAAKDFLFDGSGFDLAADLAKAQTQTRPAWLSDGVSALAGSGPSSTEAKVTVNFANAPRGMRVSTDPQNTADTDYTVGYQMGLTP